jgi:fucose 4-O-acetylase-like acetyltransferase
MNPGIAVAVALASSLLLGAVMPTTLDLSRMVGLLPFFVLGLIATPDRLADLRRPKVRAVAVPVLVLIWWLTTYTDTLARTEWLYYRTTYSGLDADLVTGALLRAGVIAAGLAGGAAFLALVPSVDGWFTRLGAMSLVVYLCHGFVVLAAGYAGYDSFAVAHPGLALPLTTAAAIGLAVLLAARPLAGVLQHLVDPFGYAQGRVVDALRLADVVDDEMDRSAMDLDRRREPVRVDR